MLNVIRICTFILIFSHLAFAARVTVVIDTEDTRSERVRQEIEPDLIRKFGEAVIFDYRSPRLAEFISKVHPDLIVAVNGRAAGSLINLEGKKPLNSSLIWISNEPFESSFAEMSNLTSKVFVAKPFEKRWQQLEVSGDNYQTYSYETFVNEVELLVKKSRPQMDERFGTFLGSRVQGAQEAVAEVDRDFPSDLEVLLGHRTLRTDIPNALRLMNPFGHIAIRIRDTVYTVNFKTKAGDDPLHIQSSLTDYLTSTDQQAKNYKFIGMLGQSYGREHLGLRISGISKADLDMMEAEFKKLEVEFNEGKTKYISCYSNCADFVYRALRVIAPEMRSPGFVSLPLAVFDASLEVVAKRKLPFRLIRYGHVNSPSSFYSKGGRALGIAAPVQLLLENVAKWIGKSDFVYDDNRDVSARVFYSAQKKKMIYENVERRHSLYCKAFYLGGQGG